MLEDLPTAVEKPKTHSFRFSNSNITYLIFVTVVAFFSAIMSEEFKSEGLGYSAGTVIGYVFASFILPFLFAFAVWFLRGRKENGGTTTFNIILTIVLLSMISKCGQRVQEKAGIEQAVQQTVNQYKSDELS